VYRSAYRAKRKERLFWKGVSDRYAERRVRRVVFAVDFDGYLCKSAWPDIGEPNFEIIQHFRGLREQGHKLILWTCREGELLQAAIEWCADFGLGFDAVNTNLPERIEQYGGDCRKISADWYCDDRNYWIVPYNLVREANNDRVERQWR
jgi:hypothetical protein